MITFKIKMKATEDNPYGAGYIALRPEYIKSFKTSEIPGVVEVLYTYQCAGNGVIEEGYPEVYMNSVYVLESFDDVFNKITGYKESD